MKINEIFYSIQGEGQWTGLPNIFIRTTGCNLRCSFCDTKYAYENGREIQIKQIIEEIKKFPCKKICITGGEPLIQKDTFKLIETLLEEKFFICLETNGSKLLEKLPKNSSLIISLDVKCPSSKMNHQMKLENIKKLQKKDQIKFIIRDLNDYIYAKKITNDFKPNCLIYYQPVWGTNPKYLAEWIKNDGLNVSLGLQIHKIIWGEKIRGV